MDSTAAANSAFTSAVVWRGVRRTSTYTSVAALGKAGLCGQPPRTAATQPCGATVPEALRAW